MKPLIPQDKQYVSPLQRVVPFVNKESEWYKDKTNKEICIWCKSNPIVHSETKAIVWCAECYRLHYLKTDGTYQEVTDRFAIGKDLKAISKDMSEGKTVYNPSPDFRKASNVED